MPSRIIREGILSSDRVDKLDAAAEVFYRRLLSKVDDYGRFDGRPGVLRAGLYPLRIDRVREADITRWMAACQKAGLVVLYTHDDKPYVEALDTGWTKRSPSKCPAPPAGLQTFVNNCAQLQTNVLLDVVVDVVEDVVVDEGATRRVKKDKGVTFLQWVESLDGADAVPADDSIFTWAEMIGVPRDWIALAWWVFESRYAENNKTYTDWRAVFRKAVREDWLKVWRHDARDDCFVLTTTGIQAQREMAA